MKLFLRSILFSAVACFTPFATAQTVWTGGAGDGNFDSVNNWSNGVPTSSVSATVDTGANITVSSNPSILGLTVNANNSGFSFVIINGFVTFVQNSNSSSVNLNIANSDTLTIVGATPTVNSNNVVVNNGAALNLTGNLTFNNGIFTVGTDSTGGALNISSGTLNYDVQTTADNTQLVVAHGTGAIGGVVQSGSSTVITGQSLSIGVLGGTGSYTLTGNSTLDIGTPNNPKLGTYFVSIGSNQYGAPSSTNNEGSTGYLTISNSSTFNLGTGANLLVGAYSGTITNVKPPPGPPVGFTAGTGTITQNGAGSTVNFQAGSAAYFGTYNGGQGTYNLSSGSLFIDNTTVFGAASGAVGSLDQTGGTLTASAGSSVTFGATGTGSYLLTGGSATFNDGFTVGANGTLTQSAGSSLTASNPVSFASGSIYNMNGGTATYNGTLTENGTLNLNGGTLTVQEDSLLNTTGSLNFGGGTLKLTAGTTSTFNNTFSGGVLAANTTSTIDASTSGLNTFNFANPLLIDAANTGGGGIILIGNGSTAFNFNSASFNTYTGSTTIENGILNISGGNIYNTTTNTYTSSLNLLSNSTINLALGTTSVTYPGTITGTGNLNVNFNAADETLALTNSNNSAGAVNITLGANTGPNASATPGTLEVNSGSFGTISDNGTVSAVTIGGNGTTGTVTFADATYSGLTTVDQGYTLNTSELGGVGAGGATNNGTLNVTNTIFGNVINGNTNTAAILTATSVNGNVSNGGTFTASNVTGDITSNTGTVASNATLGSVKDTPTFTVGGNLSSTGTIVIRMNGGNADLYNVTGTADVSGSNILVKNGTGSATYHIIDSTGLTAVGVTTNAPTTLFSVTVAPDTINPNELDLITVQKPLAPFALTPNQNAVAGALDTVIQTPPSSFVPLLSVLNVLPAGAIPGALDELSPESLQYSSQIAIGNATFMASEVDGMLANLRAGFEGIDDSGLRVVNNGFDTNLGMSLGSLLAYNAPSFNRPAPNGVNYYPQDDAITPSASSSSPSSESSHSISDSPNPETTASPNALATSEPDFKGPHLNEFILGNVVLADMNQDQGAPNAAPTKASYTAGNVAAGISFRMTSSLSTGVLFDYNHTDAKTDSSGSKTKVDTYSPGLFATYSKGGFFVNGLFSFGYNNYTNTRNIGFLGTTASSKPSGQQYVTNLDGGYDFQPRNHRQWIFGPNIGMTYTHLDVDSFTETGAGPADLMINSQSIDSLRSRLGGHVTYQARSGAILFQPNFSAMWQHEFLDNSSGITSQFNIPGTTPFTIQSAHSNKDSALLGCGLTATLDNSMAFYLDYLANVGASDYFAQSIEGGFKASF